MKIKEMISRGLSSHVYRVELTEQEIQNWSDGRIITSTDRRGPITDETWALIESGEQHPGHFGGSITHFENGDLRVTVYVD